MDNDPKGTGRRTLLQRGVALIGGGVAVVAGARWSRAEAATPPAAPTTLTLYAKIRPPAAPAGDTRLVASGELLDQPGGAVVGAFHTNCFCLATPFGRHDAAASNLEFRVLQLHDGTLFGVGGGVSPASGKAHAIIGGTERYAGARGNCLERAIAGADEIELIVTLAN